MYLNTAPLAIGIILLLFAFMVGVKKQTWLLSGFNQHRVRDKEKLSRLVGHLDLSTGLVLILSGLLTPPTSIEIVMGILVPIILVAHLGMILYVQKNMVE
ncbi:MULTISPECIES: DUF3784 domain-containing protein [Pontibacillus]|uniref:DUF3784 domain-containing protein n=1 Tax=Pontibacillus chungwhensis TaxID=265426 RepID=A0ABY8UTN1_9BACI|nr:MULTISPECIES: DUF3784 domain-containing protein [Pontibacillus]MCD5323403.1 DUF3784 domain-containing protein [Pontibacillus sp. HN14]WIF96783.1 DUF3784 domain-containing protein [Pontibacillus chungwhensis]